MVVKTVRRALAALVACSCAWACSSSPRSEEELRADLESFIRDKRACGVDSDCALASLDCPVGCQTAVAKAYVAVVEAKSRELVAEYKERGQSCAYDCVPVDARCQAGLCTAAPR